MFYIVSFHDVISGFTTSLVQEYQSVPMSQRETVAPLSQKCRDELMQQFIELGCYPKIFLSTPFETEFDARAHLESTLIITGTDFECRDSDEMS